MQQSRLPILLFLIGMFLYSNSFSQKFVAVDKGGRIKRVRYFQGDYIQLKTIAKENYYGTITSIDSNSFNIGPEKIHLSDVCVVYRKNAIYGLSLLSKVSLIAGIGNFTIDSGNRLINKEFPTVRDETVRLGAGLVLVSFLSNHLSNKRLKINKRHPIKIIDIGI